MQKVDHTRPEYDKALPIWELCSDCDEGSKAVKDKGTDYLPKPNADDKSDENETRYTQYKTRANFFNATRRTLDGLTGQVFRKEPDEEIPTILDSISENIDGAGVSLEQQSKSTLRDVLKLGRKLLLADYPDAAGDTTREDFETGRARPIIVEYDAQSVLNWRTERIGGREKVTMIVIKEEMSVYEDEKNRFKPKTFDIWRVLEIENGVYVVKIYKKEEKTQTDGEQFILIDVFFPLDASGRPWDEIPAEFVGSVNNDVKVDSAPIYDIASLNVGHYRNSADYEESCFIVGQPTVWASGLTDPWIKNHFPKGLPMGGRGGLPLPEDSAAGLIQAAPNSQPFEAMQHKERQMIALGARMVEQRDVQRTAKEASMSNASETSILASIANNVSDAYERMLGYAHRFIVAGDVDPELIRYRLNTEFDVVQFTSDLMNAINATWTLGQISDTEHRRIMRNAGMPLDEDEEWRDEVENKLPNVPGTQNALAGTEAANG